jgi:hypothetical protein
VRARRPAVWPSLLTGGADRSHTRWTSCASCRRPAAASGTG